MNRSENFKSSENRSKINRVRKYEKRKSEVENKANKEA